MRAIDRSPAWLSSKIAIMAALLALLANILYPTVGVVVVTVGVLVFVAGSIRGSWRLLTLGAVVAFVGTILSGVLGVPVEALLVATTATVLSWDFGQYAIGVGQQLGRDADTGRMEAVHLAASTLVGALVTIAGYGFYQSISGNQPSAAFVFLAVAAVLIAAALS